MEKEKYEGIRKLESYVKMGLTLCEQMNDCAYSCIETLDQIVKVYNNTIAFKNGLLKMTNDEAEFEAKKLKNLYENVADLTENTKQKTGIVGKNLYTVAQGVYNSTFEIEKDFKELTSDEKKNCLQGNEELALCEKQKAMANEYGSSIKNNEKTFVDVVKTKETFDQNTKNLANISFAWQTECLQEIEKMASEKFDFDSPVNLCVEDIKISSQIINENITKNRENLNYCKICGDNLGHNFYYLYEVNQNLKKITKNMDLQNQKSKN